jgi:hypothetical protein
MHSVFSRGAAVAVVLTGLAVAAPGRAHGQVEFSSKAMAIKIDGRLHFQFNHTSVESEEQPTTFFVRRARLEFGIKVNDFISGKLQPEFGEGETGLRDAFVTLSFSPVFHATFGQFKRPFDMFELTSSTQILVIERAGGIRGVDACSGVGNVCSLSRFTEKLNYSDRDIGVMVDGDLGTSGLHYYASATNGRGANTDGDENGAKSFSGRLEYDMGPLRLGGHVGLHDYANDSTGTDEMATAFGGDVNWGEYETPGPHVQAGFVYGDNWKNLTTPDPSAFLAGQVIGTYMFAVANNEFLYGIEPLFRASFGNPDTDVRDDEGWIFTPGVVFYLSGRNKFAVNVDVWKPTTGDTEYSLKAQTYLHF